jgi:sulfur carrier protein
LTIRLNGEPREVPEGTTVIGLLQRLGMRPELCAVERNGEVVPRAQHGQAELREGDTVEVVTFVGGG